MDGIKSSLESLESLEISVKRLASAVDALEWATEVRMRHDKARATTQEEFALMQDDRSRLAVELDAAVDRSRALESANSEAAKRLAHAAQAIERVLGRLAPDAESGG
jgi:predicted  nucleic acid-binding Zn-ribbon protein